MNVFTTLHDLLQKWGALYTIATWTHSFECGLDAGDYWPDARQRYSFEPALENHLVVCAFACYVHVCSVWLVLSARSYTTKIHKSFMSLPVSGTKPVKALHTSKTRIRTKIMHSHVSAWNDSLLHWNWVFSQTVRYVMEDFRIYNFNSQTWVLYYVCEL